MSPLLFLAIAAAVPLLGMIVLGTSARIKRGQVTDDETEPFRRRLESIAPPDAPGRSPGNSADGPPGNQPGFSLDTPGLAPTRRGPQDDRIGEGALVPAGAGAAIAPDADGIRHRSRRRSRTAAGQPVPLTPSQNAPTTASIRLVERTYTVPLLPPLNSDLDESARWPEPRSRRRGVTPRPSDGGRGHDRGISSEQGRRPGS